MATPRLIPIRRHRRISRLLALLLAPFCGWSLAQNTPPPSVLNLSATALPRGGQVRVGSGQITQAGQLLLIQQSTSKLGIDWQSFDIGRDATVEFRQPGAGSIALNRVLGHDPSAIYGRLVANGQVFLTNPHGVLFAPGSKVDVGGLIASTLDLSQDDFAAGALRFEGDGHGSVVHQGRIEAERYAALFGAQVDSAGEIVTPGGSVVLAAGRAATVALDEHGLLSATVAPSAGGRIDHRGTLDVGGGRVQITAHAMPGQAPALVNTDGVIRASAIEQRGGEVVITGDVVTTRGRIAADGRSGGRILVRGDMQAGRIDVGGSLSAIGSAGAGGHIETSAAQVAIEPAVQVDTRAVGGRTGSWLIDPTDFVVGAGGAAQTDSGIGATALQNALAQTSVVLETAQTGTQAGDIRVEAPVTWSADTTLTLSAIHHIEINADLTATGNSAGLTLLSGSGRYTLGDGARITLSGSSPLLSINGESYIVVNSLSALQGINASGTALARNYALGTDIDATATAGWNDGAGFAPIGGNGVAAFSGDFDGLGHRITGLTINRPNSEYAGLFGYVDRASLRNLRLEGGSIAGGRYSGALVGYQYGYGNASAGIENVHADLPVSAVRTDSSTLFAGGLAGYQYYNEAGVSRSSSSGDVFVDGYNAYAGGLLGYVQSSGTIVDSQASGDVTRQGSVYGRAYGSSGGLVGEINATSLRGVSASGRVDGGDYVGGLVGQASGSASVVDGVRVYAHSIADASASGAVHGNDYTGGLVGYVSSVAFSDVSSSGAVTGDGSYVGGLTGYHYWSPLTRGQASGAVAGTSGYTGGLVGYANRSDIVDSSATGDVSGGYASGGLIGSLSIDANGGVVRGSRASGSVTGTNSTGGLVGEASLYNYTADERIAIADSHATGSVSGRTRVGGLIGEFSGTGVVIEDSSASGRVLGTGTDGETNTLYLGGLIGYAYDYSGYYHLNSDYARGGFRRNHARGDVAVSDTVAGGARTVFAGGLIGYFYNYGNDGVDHDLPLTDSHAGGAVEARAAGGTGHAGGLVGYLYGGAISRTYASGAVSASGFTTAYAGGLVGRTQGGDTPVADSYWNATTTGQALSPGGGTALGDAQMRQSASFAGWDLSAVGGENTVWRIYEGLSQPLLRGQLTPLALTLSNASKTYDGSNGLGDAGYTADGGGVIAHPERILVAGLSPDVGSLLVGASALYSTQDGYDLVVGGSGTLSTVPRVVTLEGVVADKVYNGNLVAGFVAGAQPKGLVAGEDLTLGLGGATASFADKNAGIDKAVTVGGYTVGDGASGKAANYTVLGSATADILPKALDIGGFTAADRVYDGSTGVTVSYVAGAPSGVVVGDTVAVSNSGAAGAIADRHAGVDRPVTVTGVSLTGTDAGNYRIAGIDTLTVTIEPKPVAVNGLSVADRDYNGSTAVTVNGSAATLAGLVAGDQVLYANANLTGTMADRHVGTDKTVVVGGLTLAGQDARNYTPAAADLTVTITPRAVTGYVYQLYNSEAGGYGYKVYDGSTDASAVAVAYGSGLVGNDDVVFDTTAITFAGKDVAYSGGNVANQTITASGFSLSGADAGNYTLANDSNTTTGRIVPRPLSVTGVTAVDRIYDGSVNVAVNIDGAAVDTTQVVSGDEVSVTVPGGGSGVVGTVATKHVGTDKAVSVPGLALAGLDAGNYTLTGSNGVTVDITRKELRVQYAGQDRVYDGTTRATAVASSSDVVAGDSVTFYTNLYGNTGCTSGYYSCYANFSGTGAKDVGDDKPIAIAYEYLYGSDAGNYLLVDASSGTATASITPRAITPSVTGVDKVYDGTAAATVMLNAAGSGIVGGDVVEVGTSNALFTGDGARNVGTAKPIAVTGITLAGADAFNYSLASSSASTTASITARPVGITGISAVDRVYDGTLTVVVSAASPAVNGLVAGDDVSAVLPVGGITSGTLADRHVGSDKPFAVAGVSLTGADAGNYTLAGSGGTVDITPKPIAVSYTGADKVYNGNTLASVTGASDGVLTGVGDVVGFAQSAAFETRNAGVGRAIAVTGISLTGSQAGNYVLLSDTATTSATITPKPVTVSYTGVDRVYNGAADTSATVLAAFSGKVDGDSLGSNHSARFAGDGRAAAGKTVDVSDITLAGVDAGNYLLGNTSATTTASILPRALGVAGMQAVDRVYDGTSTVQVNVTGAQVDLTGVLSGDAVTVSLPPAGITSGEMADRHVGADKAVSVTGLLLGGADAANYTLTGDDALTVTISPRAVTAVYAGIDKIYDGGVLASVSGSVAAFVSGDSVAVSATGQFTGPGAKNVGTDKAVSVSNGLLTGVDRFNYTLANPAGSTTASITPRTVTAVYTGGERVYDGTTAAPVTSGLSNLVFGDTLTLTQTASFTGPGAKDVGDAKPIAVADITLGGADVGNYLLANATAATAGRITPRPVVVEGLSGIEATDRVYDGSTLVAVNVPTGLTGNTRAGDVLAGETVVVDLPAAGATSGHMLDKHAGNAKTVLVDGLGLSGADAGNYMIASASGLTVNIARLDITAVYAGLDKVYDGNSLAQVGVTLPGTLAGDTLTGSATGLFTGGRNAGLDKAIAVTGGLLGGADAGNYRLLNAEGSTAADITPKTVTTLYTGGTRVYDGGTAAPVTGSVVGVVAGDSLALTQSAAFGDKNVGSGKLVSVSGIALAGADAGNYALASTTGVTTGSITPRPVVIEGLTVSAQGREYDGTTEVAVQVTATAGAGARAGDLIAGDDVSLLLPPAGTSTGQMADKHAGTGKSIVVDGLGLTGGDAGNYSVVGSSGLTVDIAPRTLTATWSGVDRIYDGTDLAAALGSGDRVIAGDDVSITGVGVFTAGRNVGTGLAISIGSAVLGGADAANYALTDPTGNASASITPKTLTVHYSGGTRVYDGSTSAPVIGVFDGLIDGDVVSLQQTATFTGAGAKNVGEAKPVAVTGIGLTGSDAANYRSDIASTTTTADVTPRPVVLQGLTASATGREYDGTTGVVVDLLAASGVSPRPGDLIVGDDVGVTVPGTGTTTGTMADKHVGLGKAVVITGLGLTGTDAANYRIEGVNGVTVDITPRTLTAVWTGVDKVYDGTAAGTATGVGDRTVVGDDLVIGAAGVFTAGRNAGTGLRLDLDGGTLSGADAGNYLLLNPSGSVTAAILPRTVTAVYTGVDKVYDGGTAATVVGTLDNIIDGDTLTLSQSAVFTSGKNVGADKAVVVASITLGGSDAGNYVLASGEAGTTASITPRALTVAGLDGLSAVDRAYDGTRQVALTGSLTGTAGLQGLVGGDDLSLVQGGGTPTQGLMLDKHVGVAKGVVIEGLSLAGADAINYVLAETLGLTVTITPRTVTAGGLTAVDRAYDGTNLVALNTGAGVLAGALAGDDLRLRLDGATASMADRHVGTGKPVTLDGAALDGSDAGNYRLVSADELRVTITPRLLTAVYAGIDKVYDGSVTAGVSGSSADRLGSDELVIQASGRFTGGKNAGTGKAIDFTGATLSGADAANYLLQNPDGSTTASITPRPVSALYTGGSRVYDGDTGAPVSGTVDGLIAGDRLALSQSAAFDDRNAGTGKAITITGITLAGDDAGNYVLLSDSAATTGTVTPRELILSATAQSKVYGDVPLFAGTEFTAAGLVAGETVGRVTHESPGFAATADVGSYLLTIGGAEGGSFDPGNYVLSYQAAALLVNPRPLTLSALLQSKRYGEAMGFDPAAFAVGGRGLVDGDSIGAVQFSSAGALPTAHAGDYALALGGASGGRFDPANYSITYEAGTLRVTPRPLTVATQSVIRHADEPNPSSFGFSANGLVNGDQIASVLQAVPPASIGAPGGSVFALLPGGALFASGLASDYELRYQAGLLIVLPKPPRIDDPDGGTTGGGDPQFAIVLDPEDLARAEAALQRSSSTLVGGGPTGPAGAPAEGSPEATDAEAAAVIAALLRGETQQVSLPVLLRLPLISMDPNLRRMILGAVTTP